MNIEKTARELIPLLGGRENIASAAHCATRLRLVMADDEKVQKEAIEALEGVKGCFRNAGQMQIIFGSGIVNKVHAAFVREAGIGESSKSEVADIAAKNSTRYSALHVCCPIFSSRSFRRLSLPVC